jgi:hypothetical protein
VVNSLAARLRIAPREVKRRMKVPLMPSPTPRCRCRSRWQDRCRLPVLRLRPRPRPAHQRALRRPGHRHRPAGLDRRHPNHPTSTTPTTPKNSCTPTPTHPTTTRRSDIGAQRLSGSPVARPAPRMPPAVDRPSAPKPVSVASSVTMPAVVAVPIGRLNYRRPRIRLGSVGVGDSCADAEGGRADDAGDRDAANQSFDIHRVTPSKSITNRED